MSTIKTFIDGLRIGNCSVLMDKYSHDLVMYPLARHSIGILLEFYKSVINRFQQPAVPLSTCNWLSLVSLSIVCERVPPM